VRVALGQINPTVGDFEGNRRLVLDSATVAEQRGAELVVFPELALAGYPPKDLLERPAFIEAAQASLRALAAEQRARGARAAILVGFPERLPDGPTGRGVSNSAALVEGGEVAAVARKSLLPTYDVFDEWRYFDPAVEVAPIEWRGHLLGVSICEDIWNDPDFWPHRLYRSDPVGALVKAGAQVIINVSASPYTIEKRQLRPRMLSATARRWARPLLFVNQVGGQDDLVFDGASMAFDARGEVVARGAEHASDLVVVDVGEETAAAAAPPPPAMTTEQSALGALELGVRDYARRCGFSQALLGLSGGVDSALVACIAARALGPKNVLGVAMPSRFSSEGSLRDAQELARNLGIDFTVVSIEPMFAAYLTTLAPVLQAFAPPASPEAATAAEDLTSQNLQARIRGALLMAFSNRQGRLLLTTGNKSEVATGYCTLYGDMAGGLAVISDVPKTLVYRLARAINADAGRAVIPEATLTKPPSAELRPDQTDQDSLPPYDVLDPILDAHLVDGLDGAALVAAGFDRAVVEDVVRRVRVNEYKRRQMPPGLKITGKAFGPGRRVPIAQAWRG
jgi:NAD+ synthase (glutamine-hydrolysing)